MECFGFELNDWHSHDKKKMTLYIRRGSSKVLNLLISTTSWCVFVSHSFGWFVFVFDIYLAMEEVLLGDNNWVWSSRWELEVPSRWHYLSGEWSFSSFFFFCLLLAVLSDWKRYFMLSVNDDSCFSFWKKKVWSISGFVINGKLLRESFPFSAETVFLGFFSLTQKSFWLFCCFHLLCGSTFMV